MPKERNCGVVVPPWEATPYGVVSLLNMLEFAAEKFVDVTHRLGFMLGEMRGHTAGVNHVEVHEDFNLEELLKACRALGLRYTAKQANDLMIEIAKECPSSVHIEMDGGEPVRADIVDAQINSQRTEYHIEAIYKSLRAELGSRKVRIVPLEKDQYCDEKWLTDTILFQKFPDTVDEFQRAGRCFAYGENTACFFHLMRVVDFYLRKVADTLRTHYDPRSWHDIGNKICNEMQKKYQEKSDEWKKCEPFYAEVLTDIQAIGRGHRNPGLHELEKKYDEREAAYMLTVVEAFARHVAGKL